MTISEMLAAETLSAALVDWSGERVSKDVALDLAKRYLGGEKYNCLAWTVFNSVVADVTQ